MPKKTAINVPVALTVSTAQAATASARTGVGSLMSMLSGQYANLSTGEKAMWNVANNHVQSPSDPENNTKRGANGWTLYYTCSQALLNAQQPLVRVPGPIAQPENLPPIRVDASYLNNTPVITLVPNTAYAAGPTITLWATPVVPLGNGSTTEFKSKSYRKIGTIVGGIPAGGVNVAEHYLSVFPSVPKSCKIGFKLQAVNPGGYHSAKLFTVGLTPALTLADFGQATDDLQLAMGG